MPSEYAVMITEIIRLIRLIIEDIPSAERQLAWKRHFKFWEPFWKLAGLDVTSAPYIEK